MPHIAIHTNCTISPVAEKALKTDIGNAITLLPGKTESYLMVSLHDDERLWFAGYDTPAALIEVTVLGALSHSACGALTERLTQLVSDKLSVPPARIYVKYAATPEWGWQGHQL